jgi:hypothetical protein
LRFVKGLLIDFFVLQISLYYNFAL